MRRSLVFLSFLLVASLGFSSSGDAQVTYQASFSESDLLFDRKNGFDAVGLRDCINSQDVGHPDLPVKVIHLALPSGSQVQDVSVVDEHHIVLDGEYLIAPDQPDQKTDGSNLKAWVGPDPQVYDSDSLYPSQLVEVIQEGYLAGSHLLALAIHPLRYHPTSRKLFFHTRVTIRVDLSGSEKNPSSSQTQKRSVRTRQLYEGILHQFVDNRIEILNLMSADFPSTSLESYPGGLSYCSYLVITSSELESSFLPLVEWKVKKGIDACVVCVDSILTSYSGRDDAEKLRNFLIEAYQQGTVWVLLGGDEDVVPVRYAYPTNASTVPSIPNQQICDLYFSDVDGEWDLDNDGIWGEPQHDAPDIYPDLFVGRVPCDDPSEAEAFVEKLLSYEKNPGNGEPDYLTQVLWMSSDQMKDWDGGNGQHNLVAPHIPANFYQDLVTLIESPTGDAENPVSPHGETCVEVMNQGWGIIGVLAHGKSSGFVAKSNLTNSSPRSWVLTLPGEGDDHGHMPNLGNEGKYGIMYSISCSQSAIDVDKYPFMGGEPSVGEFYPLVSRKAGVAFLGYSRWGWVSLSYKLFEEFLDNVFDPDLGYHIGVAEALSRCVYPYYRDIDYGHNLFGDPEMRVWTETPKNLSVVHPEQVSVGEQTINLSVTSQGAGVGQALVCFVLQGGVRFLGETDQDGNLSCDVNLDDVGEMSLVVSKSNFIPYEDSITVSLVADVDDDDADLGTKSFRLLQNFPNPFNPVTSIRFSVPGGGTPTHTTLKIYNILGQKVRALVDEPKEAGNHQVIWDGKDSQGREVSSGIYFYTLKAGDHKETKKMTVTK